MRPISLIDLQLHHCRYPQRDADGLVMYCGQERAHRLTPYCQRHHSLCYIGFQVKKRSVPMAA